MAIVEIWQLAGAVPAGDGRVGRLVRCLGAGEWSSPDPVPLFELFMRNRRDARRRRRARRARDAGCGAPWHRLRRNDREGARRNIEYHYDLGNDFYALWLDPSMTYSSAMFAGRRRRSRSKQAQRAKLAAILDRTGDGAGRFDPRDRLRLGIVRRGRGAAGREVHGITLSSEQKRAVEARMARAGLAGVTVSLTDYRDVAGQL